MAEEGIFRRSYMDGVSTIKDLALAFSDMTPSELDGFIRGEGRRSNGKVLAHTDDPLVAGDTGVSTTTYSPEDIYWVAHFADMFQILPVLPWPADDGIQAISTEEATTAGAAESGAIVDTDVPTVTQYTVTCPFIQSAWEFTWEAARVAKLRGGGILNEGTLDRYYDTRHPDELNTDILADASSGASGAGGDRYAGTEATDGFEALDRLIANDSEEDAFGGSHDHWFDPYSATCDRDTGTTYDAGVSHNSGTDRLLTDEMIDDAIETVIGNGARKEDLVIVTSLNTKSFIERQWDGQISFAENVIMHNVGMTVDTYKGIPIHGVVGCPADTIGRVYILDTAHIGIWIYLPTTKFVASNPILLDTLKTKKLMVTGGQLVCTNFKTQYKIRDLKRAA